VRLFPVSLERIIADNRVMDAVYRKSWSWKDYIFRYIIIIAIIAIVIIVGPETRVMNSWRYSHYIIESPLRDTALLTLPLWMYGVIIIASIIACTILNILDRKRDADVDDELIEYIISGIPAEKETYCQDEIKDILLKSYLKKTISWGG